ncbi:MAG TPA: phosphatase PAP2 family protein [Chthoniobacterales bacterium]
MIATGETASKQTDSKPGNHTWLPGALVFLVLGLLTLLTFQLDDPAEHWIREHRTKLYKDWAGHISEFGDWPWLMAAGAAAGGICWWRGKRELTRVILMMMLASTLAGAAANTLRLTTGRTRPNVRHVEQGFYGLRHDGKWLIGTNKFNSFPSGHTATAFGFLAVPFFLVVGGSKKSRPTPPVSDESNEARRSFYFGAVVGYLLLAGGVVMALARMTIDAHHLSDVCLGAWFGFLGAWVIVTLDPARKLLSSRDTHETVHPRGF